MLFELSVYNFFATGVRFSIEFRSILEIAIAHDERSKNVEKCVYPRPQITKLVHLNNFTVILSFFFLLYNRMLEVEMIFTYLIAGLR